MTIKEIVEKYLKENGYDGLVNVDSECGCGLEDLMPCDNECGDCECGFEHKCPEGHESDWLMTLSKEKPDFGSED